MALKLKYWTDEEASKEIKKRFANAQQARRNLEDQWVRNETAVYGKAFHMGGASLEFLGGDYGEEGSDSPDISVAYTFKNLRFIHSQLSANPPSVAMRPTSSDQEDFRKADAADRTVRYMLRQYEMQEVIDTLTLNTLIYGTGVVKTIWNPQAGDLLSYNPEEGEMDMEGDIEIDVPFTRNIYMDPDARSFPKVRWIIEKIYMDVEDACAIWPEKQDQIKQAKASSSDDSHQREETRFNSVEILEYWETGLPANGFMGRFCRMLVGGTVLDSCRPSPHRFPKAGAISKLVNSNLPDEVIAARMDKLPQMATLPYNMLTDIDVSTSLYGKSFLEYAAPLQEVLGQIDSAYIDNIRANGVARMVVSDTTDVNVDLSNSPWDVTKVSNNQAPFFMEVPNMMPEMASSRQNMIGGIDAVSGVNDSMQGLQQREQSGASMQYATNQGNMIRRRLFNKYVLVVERVYKSMLNLARKHWTMERSIAVLGKEKAFEALSLKGADIDGGYDCIGEYGTTLSLDPISRRQEIMQLQPVFEKAGVPPRMSMKMLKLNDLEGMHDKLQMADDRQREIFEEQIARNMIIPPEKYQDHDNMIAYALDWFMTAEYKYLSKEEKALCTEHLRLRIEQAATEKSGGLSGQPQPPGPAGGPGEAPAPAEGAIPGAPAMPPIVNG